MRINKIYLLMVIGCAALFVTVQANAQEGANNGALPIAITMAQAQLKAFEGVFQNAQNKEMNVQFTADSNCLNAKLLWNGGQLKVYPQSELVFFSKEGERVSISFIKAADGSINQVNVAGNGLWNRVKNYKPSVKIEAPHTPEQLKVYEGLYESNDNYLQFTVKDNSLVLKQQWDGVELPFVPDSTWSFFNKQQLRFTLDFTKGANGEITKVVAFKRDVWTKTTPPNYTPDQLKTFEGKYQLKVDNDDVVQITASGGNLVVKQLWDGKETVVAPMAELYFYNDKETYPLKFIKNADGTITQVTALNGEEFERMKN